MAIVLPNNRRISAIKAYLGQEVGVGDVTYKFFVNDLTPTGATGIGDFAAADPLIAPPFALDDADWDFALVGGAGQASQDQQTVPIASAITLYGYYVVATADLTELRWSERFEGGPFTWPAEGGELLLTPIINAT